MKEPTDFQKRFCEKYIQQNELNATQAYKDAGGKAKRADQAAYELLRKPECKLFISKLKAERVERTKIDSDWVLERLAKLADVTIGDYITIDENGQPVVDLSDCTEEQLALLDGISVSYGQYGDSVDLKLPPILKVLDLIGKHVDVSAFKEKVEHSGPDGGPITTATLTQKQALALLKKNNLK